MATIDDETPIQAPQAGLEALGQVGQGLAGPAVSYVAPGGQVPFASATDPTAPAPTPGADPTDSIPGVYAPTAAAAPLPDLPGGVPNVPAPAVAQAPHVVSTPVIPNKSGADTGAIDQARMSEYQVADAKAKEGALEGDQIRAESEAQGKLADVAHLQSIDTQAEIQAQKDGLAEARRVADQAAQEARDFKFHDYFSDKTTGQKIAAALFVGLGGIGAGLQARVNPNAKNMALEAIDANVAQDFEKQKQKLVSKENFARYKAQGVQDLTAQYRDDLAKLQLQQGLAYKAIADQAQAQLLAQKVPLAQAQSDTFVQTIRAKGDQDYAQGFQQLVRDKAQLALEKSRNAIGWATVGVARQNADTAEARVAAETKDKGAKQDLANDKELTQAVRQFDTENGTAKAHVQFDKIKELNRKLANPNITGIEAKGALMELDAIARQGTATKASLDAYMGSLGGAVDQLGGQLEHLKTGKPSASQLAQLRQAGATLEDGLKQRGVELHDLFQQRFRQDEAYASNPKLADKVTAISAGQFGRYGFVSDKAKAKAAESTAPAAPATPAPPKVTPTTLAPQYIARAKEVLANPSKYSAADVARAKSLTGAK